jgi:hypothetical protein
VLKYIRNMKKLLIGLSGILVLALAVILFVNAGTSSTVSNKATTEVKADCAKCPSASTCTEAEKAATTETASATKPACCDQGKDEVAAKTCPEASAMTSEACAGCPMSKANPK